MIDYREVLADLETRRIELEGAISAIRRLVRAESRADEQQPKARPEPGAKANGEVNYSRTVFEFLLKDPMRLYDAKAVADGTGLSKKDAGGALERLHRGKKIQRPSRGKYRAGKAQEAVAA
jgi:hypothetical protein